MTQGARTAIVLLSGGLDSATALAIARSEGFECRTLAVSYGQRHAAELEAARKLPDVILDWAQRRLGVTPHLAAGQELDLPADRLSGFALDGTLPAGGGLVRVRVLVPGWKREGRLLVPPRAIII